MNINDLKIDLSLSINGARVTPNVGQLDQISKYIYATVFKGNGGGTELSAVKALGRPKGIKNSKQKQKWSDDEVEMAHMLKSEGKTNKRIAAILSAMYHTRRSDKAVGLMFWNKKTKTKPVVGVLERVAEVNNTPIVKSETTNNLDDFQI